MNPEEKVAELLLLSGAVMLRPSQPFRFTSGILSPIYCDNRILLSKPDARDAMIDFYIEKMKNTDFDLIAGIATASIPWASILADRLRKPTIYIRKEPKGHGMHNLIEGVLEKGQRAVIVEDLISTGGTSLKAVTAAREAGAIADECIAIFTYEMEEAHKGFYDAMCKLTTLSNFTTLIRVAAEKGYIKDKDRESITKWSQNPAWWKGI